MKLVCLARSSKPGGQCIAAVHRVTGTWIRPVVENGALGIETIRYINGELPQTLDIMDVLIDKWSGDRYQPENCLISRIEWALLGRFPFSELSSFCFDGDQLFYSKTDKIPAAKQQLRQSLTLIEPDEGVEFFRDITPYGTKIRALFSFADVPYTLTVTDVVFKRLFKRMDDSHLRVSRDIYLTVSLGRPFTPSSRKDSYQYKLVAGVILRPNSKLGKKLADYAW